MSDNIETYGEMAAFASLREPAWHRLGTILSEEVDTQGMLEAAYLHNWNVRLEPVPVPDGYNFVSPSFLVVRNNPFVTGQTDVLSVVGQRYTEVQNEELFAFGDHILHGGGRWETAGAIKQGRVVFGSLALERETVLDPNGVSDKVKTYLLLTTSHDGSLAVQALVTPVRVVCQNTLNMALGRGAKQSFKIRHTQTVGGKVQAAREALGLSHAYMDRFDELAKELFETEITKAKFDEIVAKAYPRPEKDAKGALTKWTNKVDLLEEIYSSDTVKGAGIAGTAWGTYNTLTERLDWFRKGRGASGEENVAAAASGFDPVTNAEKSRLLSIVREVANV